MVADFDLIISDNAALHSKMSPLAFIIVHGGAGVHGCKDEQGVKEALKT